MKNYVQAGVNLTMPAPADVLSGSVVTVGSITGIAAETALMGSDVDVVTEGVFSLPKVSALALTIGQKIYWDATNKLVTATASGNTLLGVAVSAALNPSATVNVKLGPTLS